MLFPFGFRVKAIGGIFGFILPKIGFFRDRVHANLGLVYKTISLAEKQKITTKVAQNIGKTLIEYQKVSQMRYNSPGLTALHQARKKGKPIILVSAHYGNHDVVRYFLHQQGFDIAAIYRPLSTPMIEDFHISKLTETVKPIYAKDANGIKQLINFLKKGNTAAMLADQWNYEGELLPFMGIETMTTLSPCKLATKYSAVLTTGFATRLSDNSFEIEIDEPIPHSDAKTMMITINDRISDRILRNNEQWLWSHNRWHK